MAIYLDLRAQQPEQAFDQLSGAHSFDSTINQVFLFYFGHWPESRFKPISYVLVRQLHWNTDKNSVFKLKEII